MKPRKAKQPGRPTLYKPEYDEQARKLCLLGATNDDLAGFFAVNPSTIDNWLVNYPGFLSAVKAGKIIADAEIANSLFNRAKGYSHIETKVFCQDGQIIEHDVMKHYPPDTRAAFFWLKNRQPDKWRDKIDVEHNHKLDKDMLDAIKTDFIVRMEKARQRQVAVLIERGIIERQG